MKDFLHGKEDLRLKEIFNATGFFDGKEVIMEDYVGAVFNEDAIFRKREVKGIYTGSADKDRICKIRFQNSKNYINKIVNIDNGNDIKEVTISPSQITKTFTEEKVTNGVQYKEESEGNIYNYNPRYLEIFKYEENTNLSDDELIYGTDEDPENPAIDIAVF